MPHRRRLIRQIGARLATAAWNVAYGHDETPFVGPVLAGCAVEEREDGTRALRIGFDASLLKGDAVRRHTQSISQGRHAP